LTIDEAVLAQTNAGYAALRADPEAWRNVEEERAAWGITLQIPEFGSVEEESDFWDGHDITEYGDEPANDIELCIDKRTEF